MILHCSDEEVIALWSKLGRYTIWLWVYCKRIPMYPIFYLLKGDYNLVYLVNSRNPDSFHL